MDVLVCHSFDEGVAEKKHPREAKTILAGSTVQYLAGTKIRAQPGAPTDIINARYCTSEPREHYFGDLRRLIWEFTIFEFDQLVEKLVCHPNIMYKNHFYPTRDTRHGYEATRDNFFK